MAFGLMFVLMYLMMSGGVGSSQRNDGRSSSRPKSRRQQGELSLDANYPREKKDLFFDSFTVWNAIHEQSLNLKDFDLEDRFLEYIEAQGWFLVFPNP